MKYTVKRTYVDTWEVEREDEEPHYVRYDIFKDEFICDCNFNNIGLSCKHKLFVKQNLVYGLAEFDDSLYNKVCEG